MIPIFEAVSTDRAPRKYGPVPAVSVTALPPTQPNPVASGTKHPPLELDDFNKRHQLLGGFLGNFKTSRARAPRTYSTPTDQRRPRRATATGINEDISKLLLKK